MNSQQITAEMVKDATLLATFGNGWVVEAPEPPCGWRKLCGEQFCRFPRYFRDGKPQGLVAHVLLQLGYPRDLLKILDSEYEIGEVLHPGVTIASSRNPALTRIEPAGLALLRFLQERQKLGKSWDAIVTEALTARRMITFLDQRRRPWLY